MKIRIEYAELSAMGATKAQLDAYSTSDPLNIYQIGDDIYSVTGIIDCLTNSAGVLELLDGAASRQEEDA